MELLRVDPTPAQRLLLPVPGLPRALRVAGDQVLVGGANAVKGGFFARCQSDGTRCAKVDTLLPVLGIAHDEKRNIAWLVSATGSTKLQVHRCSLGSLACEEILSNDDLGTCFPTIVMEESRDRVLVGARSVSWYGRPALMVIDRY